MLYGLEMRDSRPSSRTPAYCSNQTFRLESRRPSARRIRSRSPVSSPPDPNGHGAVERLVWRRVPWQLLFDEFRRLVAAVASAGVDVADGKQTIAVLAPDFPDAQLAGRDAGRAGCSCCAFRHGKAGEKPGPSAPRVDWVVACALFGSCHGSPERHRYIAETTACSHLALSPDWGMGRTGEFREVAVAAPKSHLRRVAAAHFQKCRPLS